MIRKYFFAFVAIFSYIYLPATSVDTLINGLESGDYAVRQESRLALQKQLAEADTQTLTSLELTLLEYVGPGYSTSTRCWVLRMLELFGGEASVPAVSGLLADKDSTVMDCARRALMSNPSPLAVRSLESALGTLPKGHSGAPILEALSICGDESTIPFLVPYLSSADRAEAVAAAGALGKLGGEEANATLWEHYLTGNSPVARELEWALVESGLRPEQATLLLSKGSSVAIQVAAIDVLIESGDDLQGVLKEPEIPNRIHLISAIASTSSGNLIIQQLSELDEAEQLIVLGAIADSGLLEAEPIVLGLLDSDSESLRQSAIHTLGIIGSDSSFEPLYDLFKKNPDNELLRSALSKLRASEVDSTLIADLRSSSSVESKIASLELLKLRNPEGATTLINQLAGVSQPLPLRRAAFKAMQLIGDMESVSILLEVIASEKQLARDAQRSLKKLSVRIGAPSYQWTHAYLPVMESEKDVQSLRDILAILDGVSCAEGVDWLINHLAAESPLRESVLKTLSRWQDVSAGQAWITVLQMDNATPADLKTAQRGIQRLLTSNGIGGTESEKVQLAVDLLRQAPTVDLKLSIVACYAPMLGPKVNKLDNRTKNALREQFPQFAGDPDVGEQVQAVLDTL